MDLSQSEELFHGLGQFAQERMGFKKPPALNLTSDNENATKSLGRTAYYDPQGMSVTIYTDGRHTKDILRSLAHELVHHMQNLDNRLNPKSGEDGSPEENEANALAAVIMRQYGRENSHIYE